MPSSKRLSKRKIIADAVYDAAYRGLSVKALLGRIAHYQEAPTSRSGLLNVYGAEYWKGKADFQYDIGNDVVKGIKGEFEGDPDFLMFAAKSAKGGCEKHTIVEEDADEEDTDKGVYDDLARLLGKVEDD